MTCTAMLRVLLTYPDWLTTLLILFVAVCFGAFIAIGFYEFHYRVGIDYQKRQQERDQLFRETQ